MATRATRFKLDHGQVPESLCALVFHVKDRTNETRFSEWLWGWDVSYNLRCLKIESHTKRAPAGHHLLLHSFHGKKLGGRKQRRNRTCICLLSLLVVPPGNRVRNTIAKSNLLLFLMVDCQIHKETAKEGLPYSRK